MKHTIWMGYDPREKLAYDVARHSILSRTDPFQVEVRPVDLKARNVSAILARPIERKDGKLWCPISQAPMATEFAISRFCVPFLQKTGWCAFVDSDIVCLAEIKNLFALADNGFAVMCVKHQQSAKRAETKMDGQLQTFYARKNWSSCVLWNVDHPANQRLRLKELNAWPGRDLHAFRWLKDSEIGELPHEWNVLVGIDDLKKHPPAIAHYTLGSGWFPDWKRTPQDDIWYAAHAEMLSACKSAEQVKAPSYG